MVDDLHVLKTLQRFRELLDSLECECDDYNGYVCPLHSDKRMVETALAMFETGSIDSVFELSGVKRMERVLSDVFGGSHKFPRLKKYNIGGTTEMWEVNVRQDMATFDRGLLTSLVISAHDNCVRVSVGSSGPGMVKVSMWPRYRRDGSMYEYHPTIETAIARRRRWK